MDNYTHLRALGTTGNDFKGLDTFPNPGVGEITFYTEEFTSMCPVTGQPDFASLSIIYTPNDRCIESKSLKLYLQTFRNQAAFIEALVVQIRDTLVGACNPQELFVAVNSMPRGGLRLTATAAFSQNSGGSLPATVETPMNTQEGTENPMQTSFYGLFEHLLGSDDGYPKVQLMSGQDIEEGRW